MFSVGCCTSFCNDTCMLVMSVTKRSICKSGKLAYTSLLYSIKIDASEQAAWFVYTMRFKKDPDIIDRNLKTDYQILKISDIRWGGNLNSHLMASCVKKLIQKTVKIWSTVLKSQSIMSEIFFSFLLISTLTSSVPFSPGSVEAHNWWVIKWLFAG